MGEEGEEEVVVVVLYLYPLEGSFKGGAMFILVEVPIPGYRLEEAAVVQ